MGARKNEVLNLKWLDIDFEERTYKLHTNKSGGKGTKTTLHTISDELMAILLRRFDQRHPEVEYVFWHKYYSHEKKMMVEDGYKSLNKFTKRHCDKAGVPLFTLHQLRHLAASILKREGATIAELQLFLRHDEQKTTEIYAGHLDNSTKAQNELLGRVWSKQLSEVAGR
ncbi:site-specific integrase [Desulfopila sp. IMCC35008]|uniref:tyrosine-type recombinase/integrase n=1 Tax=Desulfopila sp. IMCC35008 TaxID=2653858 RepID=UPI0013D4B78D|nr:site-specific integrase [Desulfopila sp. IMCC35008]